jgi:hypothetical protein
MWGKAAPWFPRMLSRLTATLIGARYETSWRTGRITDFWSAAKGEVCVRMKDFINATPPCQMVGCVKRCPIFSRPKTREMRVSQLNDREDEMMPGTNGTQFMRCLNTCFAVQ